MAANQEESLVSGINFGNGFVMEEFLNKKTSEVDNSWNVNWETRNSHNYRDGKVEKVPEDIVDLLPRDPFGMDVSATVTTISGWIEDISFKSLGFESGEEEEKNVDDQVVGELNIVWNSAMAIHTNVSNIKSDTWFSESSVEFSSGFYEGSVLFGGEDVMGFSFEKYCIPPHSDNKCQGCSKNDTDSAPGPPPDALFFALGYLGVRDLLSIERVCKSLRDAVQDDPLLWRNIRVEYPLNKKMTNDDLLQLTKRAQGSLHSLSIVESPKITDNGLKRVLESNPGLTKLNVAGCLRLSVQGILDNLKFFKSVGRTGIKYLRLGGIFGVKSQQFEELKLLLGTQNQKQQQGAQKPRFFRAGQVYLSFDDERDIDIETCPTCQHVRQVYDCPADSCIGKLLTPQACRACTFCISRCINCGRCLSNCDYEETFCLDLICLDCWKQIISCQEGQKKMTILPKQTYLNQQASYHFFLYG